MNEMLRDDREQGYLLHQRKEFAGPFTRNVVISTSFIHFSRDVVSELCAYQKVDA